jgi:hypothetical protein
MRDRRVADDDTVETSPDQRPILHNVRYPPDRRPPEATPNSQRARHHKHHARPDHDPSPEHCRHSTHSPPLAAPLAGAGLGASASAGPTPQAGPLNVTTTGDAKPIPPLHISGHPHPRVQPRAQPRPILVISAFPLPSRLAPGDPNILLISCLPFASHLGTIAVRTNLLTLGLHRLEEQVRQNGPANCYIMLQTAQMKEDPPTKLRAGQPIGHNVAP